MACVCEPVLCAPGAGGFAMIRDAASGETTVLDFFAHTPIERRHGGAEARGVDADFGTATQAFHIGPATVATPGFFDGIEAIHARGATMTLDRLVADAAAAARAGVVVTPFQHHLSRVVSTILTATDRAAALFAPDGDVIAVGDTFRNPDLADALELLAGDGFRGSDVGRAWCAMQAAGRGHVTEADLDAYETIRRPPLTIDIDGSVVHLNPLPAAGGTLVAHSLDRIDSGDPVGVARALAATDAARQGADGSLVDLSTLAIRQRGTTQVSVVDASGTASRGHGVERGGQR